MVTGSPTTAAPPEFATLAVEKVPCPFCAEVEGRLLSAPYGRFGVVKCRRCGLVRLSPRPTAAAARRLYEAAYYDAGGYDDYVATFERFRPLYEKLFARRLRLLERHLSAAPGRLLECGCAHGFQLDWLRRRGWQVVGNDLSATASAYARDRLGLEVLDGPLEEVALPASRFDAAYLLDLVEHLSRPEEALANVRRALKPGGVLLVQVPYELFHWEKRGQALWEGKAVGTIMPDAVPYHVMFFTPRTLRLLLEKCGFRVLGRHSGNYGAVRKRLSPPRLRGDSGLETAARVIYYKLGLREALRALAVGLKQGSGVIYAATPHR